MYSTHASHTGSLGPNEVSGLSLNLVLRFQYESWQNSLVPTLLFECNSGVGTTTGTLPSATQDTKRPTWAMIRCAFIAFHAVLDCAGLVLQQVHTLLRISTAGEFESELHLGRTACSESTGRLCHALRLLAARRVSSIAAFLTTTRRGGPSPPSVAKE